MTISLSKRSWSGGWRVVTLCCLAACLVAWPTRAEEKPTKGLQTLQIESSIDQVKQPCGFIEASAPGPRPLFVFLHTWSNGYDLDSSDWQKEVAKYDWHFLQPHYRGPNWTPDACASPKARQDILDAVDYVLKHYAVDESRIYLAGASGGGHMTMVMASHAPKRWTAASAWCGISDLTAWHRECTASSRNRKYAGDIEGVVGGKPGESKEIDAQLRLRSPLFHLANAKGLPLEINTGIHDGHDGSVPVHHTLDAFNVLAKVYGVDPIPQADIDTLTEEKLLTTPARQDETFEREIHLYREAGPCRTIIFEGHHEGMPKPSCAWLSKHQRP